jgi:iron-sulfur cluster assembly protein
VKIDFVETLQGSGCAIQNPNAVRSCGCGNSFETADEAGAEESAT